MKLILAEDLFVKCNYSSKLICAWRRIFNWGVVISQTNITKSLTTLLLLQHVIVSLRFLSQKTNVHPHRIWIHVDRRHVPLYYYYGPIIVVVLQLFINFMRFSYK